MNFNYSGMSGKSSIFSKQMILRKRELEKAEETEKEQDNNDNKTSGNSPEVPAQNAVSSTGNTFMSSAEYVRLMVELAVKAKEDESDTDNTVENNANENSQEVTEDNTVNNTEQPEESETTLSKDLEKAIESGYVENITEELDKLGIAYEKVKTGIKKDKTGYYEQSLYVVKFGFGGKDYEIPYEYKVETIKYPFDNSDMNNVDVDNVQLAVELLKIGSSSGLKQLEELGIEYDM